MTRVSYYPPQFPGQEEVSCWSVWHADGIGQDDTWADIMAAVKDPAVPVWIDGENLTFAEATALVAELAEQDPERRYVVWPISPSRKLS